MRRYGLLAWLLAGAASAADPAAVEERVRQLQNGLLPPVLVRGETPAAKSLADRMAELKVPGVSIAVIDAGRIDWGRGFGVTRAGGPPVTTESLFQAASISKPVFALAVLRLADAGKVDIDANVNDYLTSWKLPENELTKQAPVTLRRLLSHSAGTTVHGFAGYAASVPVPDTVQILDGAPPANSAPIRVDLLPGARHRYSGGGYTVAQLALMDVTRSPLPKLLQDSVLAPLGMSRSTYEQPLPAPRLAEVALPHDGSGAPLAGGPHTYPEMAAAGLWTTPSDLARYAIGVQRSFAGENDALIRARTARDMLVPVVANHGVGPVIGGLPTRKYFMHGGSNAGYRCVLVAYTDGRGVVIMTNGDNGSELFGDVIRTIAHLYRWPDHAPPERVLASAAPARLSRYTGAYLLNDGATLVIHDAGGKLVGQTPKSPPYEIFPSSEREFFARVSDTVVSFGVAADGVVADAKLRVGGFERAGPRLEGMRAKPLVEAAARTWRRIADQKPMPESEAALRNLFAGLASGKPAYDTMGEDFAALTRRMLPFLQAETVKLGELKSLVFVRVGSRGEDVFHADFEHGRRRADILFDERGRIDNVMVQDR